MSHHTKRAPSPVETAPAGGAGWTSGRGDLGWGTQAERAHVGPHLLHVRQALVLGAGLAHGLPAQRDVLVRQPERVLLLVVHQDDVRAGILVRLRRHAVSPVARLFWLGRRGPEKPDRP